ncbi:phospholipase D-like protein [Actinocorallia herbida]|uniref:Phospholipase D-like protein n=1 Tax=Actinocorallia herbida TaxID=58109 RepID=A0A3N1CWL5_9ACTN|nr:AAA domain-containing protein [Actinocorallia herbida]ROO85654.1 phospholipase D-like protein [Actinocorallia herbida]
MAGGGPFPVGELARAVRAEVEAVLRAEAKNEGVVLREGRRVGGGGAKHDYLFGTTMERSPFPRAEVLVRGPGAQKWVAGEAVWTPGRKVKLTTEAAFGQQVAEVRVKEDETSGLLLLEGKLKRIGAGDKVVDVATASWMVGRGHPSVGRASDTERLVRGYRGLRLNAHQRQAIEQALGSQSTFVWGPPGTGKTEVVSLIVEGCHRQGHRVLFVAPTNVAVDQALERVCERLAGEDGFGDGLVQRSGTVAVASLEARFGDAVIPDRIAERLAARLNQERSAVAATLADAQRTVGLHTRAAHLSERYQRLRSTADGLAQEEVEAGRHLTGFQARSRRARAEAAEIGVPGGLFAQRKQRRLDELRQEIASCEAAQAQLTHRVERNRRAGLTAREELAAVEPQLQEALGQVAGQPPLAALEEAVTRLSEEQKRIDGELSKIGDVVRGRCRVMGTTVARAVQSRRLLDTVDVVVIDEAGMVDLPSAWYLSGLAGKRVVVSGDFRQLPAVTRGSGDRQASAEEQAHSREWMDRDVFHAAGLVDEGGTVRRDARLVSLVEQYRMRPAICALVNTVAYPDAPLTTGRDDTSRLPASPLIESPLVLVDTSEQRESLSPDPRWGSRTSNPVHEAVIHELIRGLQADTVLPAFRSADEGVPTERLAVIAPYRDQVGALQKSISQRFGTAFDGLVDTVHRFQGSQRPVVIIDTVAGAGDKPGFFYEGSGLSSHTCRLLNVALSRAQDHVIVVADVEFLSRTLPPGSETRRMLDYLLDHAQRLPVGDLVPVRMASDLRDLSADELVRPAFFPKDEVRRAVEWDIERAAVSLDIYCPFLDDQAVSYWIGRLRPRIAAGVRVVVHTRAHKPNEKGGRLSVRLREAGCEVNARPHMHEKVMIVDAEVLWHGSLNLLANGGPTDLMMRVTSRAACARVKQIMVRARSERSATAAPAASPTRREQPRPAPREAAAPAGGAALPARPQGVRANRFGGPCARCSADVPAQAGELLREGGAWLVRCAPCSAAHRRGTR